MLQTWRREKKKPNCVRKQWGGCAWGQGSSSLHLAGAAVCRGLLWACETALTCLTCCSHGTCRVLRVSVLSFSSSPAQRPAWCLHWQALPQVFSLSLNCFTFCSSLMSSGNLWCASAIYLRKEMHHEQFLDGLFCLLTCSCFEEKSCSGSKVLVPWCSLSEAV